MNLSFQLFVHLHSIERDHQLLQFDQERRELFLLIFVLSHANREMDIVISLFPFLLYFFPFFSLLLVTFIPFSSHTGRLSLSQLYMLIVSILNPRSYRILPYTLVVQIDRSHPRRVSIHQYLPILQYVFSPLPTVPLPSIDRLSISILLT